MNDIEFINQLNIETIFPKIDTILNPIRFALEKDENYYEVSWFLREYPRIFRHHFMHFEYRLQRIILLYKQIANELLEEINEKSNESIPISNINLSNIIDISISNEKTNILYWEFESLLSSANISIDVMTRIISPSIKNQLPPTFNKACKFNRENNEILEYFKTIKNEWVDTLKSYRDCFTHYAIPDTLLSVTAINKDSKFFIYAKIPTNPDVRDITCFKFDDEIDVLSYSLQLHQKLISFDKTVSELIQNLYQQNKFIIRTSNLFSVGKK